MRQRLAIICLCPIAVLVLAAAIPGQTRDPLPVPAIPGFKTLKCDLHLHTVFSDGEVWPTTRINEAWRDGLDALAITDHAGYTPHKDDVTVDIARGYQLARPLAARLGLILIPGVEVNEGDIHCNVLFVHNPVALRGDKLLDVLELARKQGGFIFWNHPGWKETARWFPLIAEAYDRKFIDGLELVNGSSFYPEAYPWIDERKLAILCNSDSHAPIAASNGETVRPVTLAFVRNADAEGLRDALDQRRTAAWMGDELWGPETYLKGLWEAAVRFELGFSSLRAGGPAEGIRVRNDSALPFKIRFCRTPEWLRGLRGEGTLKPQSMMAGGMAAARGAPSGAQKVEIGMEITNFHVAPGRNLMVTLPLELNVTEGP
jgi:hypothetical protein